MHSKAGWCISASHIIQLIKNENQVSVWLLIESKIDNIK